MKKKLNLYSPMIGGLVTVSILMGCSTVTSSSRYALFTQETKANDLIKTAASEKTNIDDQQTRNKIQPIIFEKTIPTASYTILNQGISETATGGIAQTSQGIVEIITPDENAAAVGIEKKSNYGAHHHVIDRPAKRKDWIVQNQQQSEKKSRSIPGLVGRILSTAYPFKRAKGDVSTNQELEVKAWRRVTKRTRARLISSNEVRFDSFGGVLTSIDELEYNLLARAAGEAQRAGFDSFIITNLHYTNASPMSILTPDIHATDNTWIGTYEELLKEREYQANLIGSSKLSSKKIRAVVQFVNHSDLRHNDTAFVASQMYLHLLNEKLFGGHYPYPKR